MNETPTASDWAAERGKKWRVQLPGMEAMLTPVDAPLIEALQLDTPYRIADIGCGGGGTTLKILRQAPAGSVVHGFDISPDLVEIAQTRAQARANADDGSLAFTLADVGRARPPGEPYDRLVSRFGIMFFDDPEAAFSNLASWLAPGGRFAFAVWGPPADNPWMTSLREAVTAVIDVPPPDPEAPGPFRYAGGEKLRTLLEAAGLSGLDIHDWRGTLSHGGGLPAAEAADFALRSFSIAEPLTEVGDEAFAAAHLLLTARFSEHEQDGAVRMDARVHIVTGAHAVGVVNAQ